MSRITQVVTSYNFAKGLITQGTGVNYPENACTETYDCVFKETGPVYRRYQFDFEDGYTTQNVTLANSAISGYLWRGVAQLGDFSIAVVQVGLTLYFYDTTSLLSLSSGVYSGAEIDLTPFNTTGAVNAGGQECRYATGLGYLFVFHPYLDPVYITYDPNTRTFSSNSIGIQIRDFAGLNDGLSTTQRPANASITASHKYNLYNQGWNATITNSATVTFTNGSANIGWPGNNLTLNEPIYFTTSGSLPTNFTANTTYYVLSGVGTNTITVSATVGGSAVTAGSAGSGTQTGNTNTPYAQWVASRTDAPSNADVWWTFRDQNNTFNLNYVMDYFSGTGPAAKGSYILSLFSQNRSTASGIGGITTITYNNRPAVGTFFAGRVWYSGINDPTLSSSIYYSQVIQSTDQFGRCYQQGDPTSEDFSQVVATDGGVLSIPQMGQVYNLVPQGNHLLVFAANGIWAITGSTGIGFSPLDYTVAFISSIRSISPYSFVDFQGIPMWWNVDGIYVLNAGEQTNQQTFDVKSLTDYTIKDFYANIPVSSKKQARGTYNPFTKVVQWLYRSTASNDVDDSYIYDRVMNFNTLTQALYPWTIPTSGAVSIGSLITAEVTGQSLVQTYNVIDHSSNLVIDSSGNQVVAFNFSQASSAHTTTKYLAFYTTGGTTKMTWAETALFSTAAGYFKDWYKYDTVGIDYTSYFISGYKLQTQGQRRFQANYLYLFTDTHTQTDLLSQFDLTPIWDWSNSGNTGRWGNTQRITFSNTGYDYQRKKIKIRGNGFTVQFKYSSVSGQPMWISGWSIFETQQGGI